MEKTIKNDTARITITIKDVIILFLSIMVALSFYLMEQSNQKEQETRQRLEQEKRDLQNTYNHLTIHNEEDLKVDSNGTVVRVGE